MKEEEKEKPERARARLRNNPFPSIVAFDLTQCHRDQLDQLTPFQLWWTAENDPSISTQFQTLEDFTQAVNDQTLDTDDVWLYPVNVRDSWKLYQPSTSSATVFVTVWRRTDTEDSSTYRMFCIVSRDKQSSDRLVACLRSHSSPLDHIAQYPVFPPATCGHALYLGEDEF